MEAVCFFGLTFLPALQPDSVLSGSEVSIYAQAWQGCSRLGSFVGDKPLRGDEVLGGIWQTGKATLARSPG